MPLFDFIAAALVLDDVPRWLWWCDPPREAAQGARLF
jgi:hypothetical protein